MADYLKDFELMVLLAVLRLDEVNAYGVPIATEIEQTTGRSVALASVYAALERLEDKDGTRRAWANDRTTRRPSETALPGDRQGRPSCP